MISFTSRSMRTLWSRLRREDGAGSIGFLAVAPVFFFVFVTAIEMQVHSVRQVMVDRALDLTVRDVRIGLLKSPSHDELTQRICDYSRVIKFCDRDIRLEMTKVDPRAWTTPTAKAPCRDREEDETDFPIGSLENNDLMILRVCVLFDPKFDYSGIGRKVNEGDRGYYALRAASSYVVEPYK